MGISDGKSQTAQIYVQLSVHISIFDVEVMFFFLILKIIETHAGDSNSTKNRKITQNPTI